MKKRTLKSLSFKKSNVAQITGGFKNHQAERGISSACPSVTIVVTIHSLNPLVCETRSCGTRCESLCKCV